jgi:hypothetical protein
MKPTWDEVMEWVIVMGQFGTPGFPTGAAGKSMLADFIFEMVNTRAELEWLCKSAFRKMRKFSMPELRGIFCTRYRPADGEEGYATETPGFTPADMETRAKEIEAEETALKIAAWKREAKLLGQTPQPALSEAARPSERDGDLIRKQLALPPGAFEVPRKPPQQAKPPQRPIAELEKELKEQIDRNRRSEEEMARQLEDLKRRIAKVQ